MKLVKVNHNKGDEEFEVTEHLIAEGSINVITEEAKKLAMCLYMFDGLLKFECKGIDDDGTMFIRLSEGLSKYAHWVRIEIRP